MANPKHIRSVDPFRDARNPFSAGYRRIINETVETVCEIQKWREKIQGLIAERFQPNEPSNVLETRWTGKIIAADLIANNRWRYTARRQRAISTGAIDPDWEDDEDKEGKTFDRQAYNRAEYNNDGTGDEGYGIPVGNDGVVDVTIKPISDGTGGGVGAYVEITDTPTLDMTKDPPEIITTYWFGAGNIPLVECRK